MVNEPGVIPTVFNGLQEMLAAGMTPVVYQPVFEGLESTADALNALNARKTYGKAVVRPVAKKGSKL